MKKLETKSCEEIMSTAYKPLEYCVDGLLAQLEYIESGDSSDGRILWVEVLESTGTRNSENVYSALFECGDSNETGAGNSQKGDGNFEMGDSNIATITAPADGDDFIAMMAENLRNQLASQGIHIKPFNSTE